MALHIAIYEISDPGHEIQDSGADSRPQTFGQARMGDSQRCSRVAPRTPDVPTLFNAIACVCAFTAFSCSRSAALIMTVMNPVG